MEQLNLLPKIKMTKNEIINSIYEILKNRVIDPSGEFDDKGRWYANNTNLINVRPPSLAWPYSELLACRTKKYVTKCYEYFKCRTVEDLMSVV